MMNHRAFARLESHLQESVLVRGVDAIATASLHAVNRSTTVDWMRKAWARVVSVPVESQVRAASVFAATAAVGHLLLLGLVPAHIAPALPRALWVTTAASALIVAAASAQATTAWTSSAVRGLWAAVGQRFRESRK